MKIQKYLLLMLVATILLVNVNAININNVNCDQIVQCDNYGYDYDGLIFDCYNNIQNTPDTEEVFSTFFLMDDYCNSSDTSSDCIDINFNVYEELNDNNIYTGRGYTGAISSCCPFAENTVKFIGIINDFNSDRENPISREWSIIDSSDTILDSCPIITYDPQDITKTTDIDTFNVSFKPFPHNYDQWVESNFDQSSIWSVQDYFLYDASDSNSYADQMKEWIQSEKGGTESWDIYDIYAFTWSVFDIQDIFNNRIEYLKDSCTAYELGGCTSSTSTSFSCTAGTGINVVNDTKYFLNAFFEKYKTPLVMRLGHRWYYGNSLSDYFTGYRYWETAYGIKDNNVFTYQGMRQLTNRTISRIQTDWSYDNFGAVFVICSNDAEMDLQVSHEHPDLGFENIPYDSLLSKYDVIKDENYDWYFENNENDVVTTDSLFRFDEENDGSWDFDWDTQYETEGKASFGILTTATTSSKTAKSETWGKGGTDTDTKNYQVYEPFINWDLSGTFTNNVGNNITFTPFDTGYYDYGYLDYLCIDIEDDGDWDQVWKRHADIQNNNCTNLDGSVIIYQDTNLYDNDFYITSADLSHTAGGYTTRIRGNMNFEYIGDYSRDLTFTSTLTEPEIDINIRYLTDIIDVIKTQDIIFDLHGTTLDNILQNIQIDYTNDGSFDYTVTDIETNINIAYSDVNSFDTKTCKIRVRDQYDYYEDITFTYNFRDLNNDAEIKRVDGSVDIGYTINETGYLTLSLGNTNVDSQHHVCWDYTNDGTYDVCYSVDSGDTQCGISCVQLADPINGNIKINYSNVNSFGSNTVTALTDNLNTQSSDTQEYFIFNETLSTIELNLFIDSTITDDDLNNDFRIDMNDYINITEDIPENKVWKFEFTGLNSDFSDNSDSVDFSCWGNNYLGYFETCYQSGGGYNDVCGLTCEDKPWYSIYEVNSSLNFDNDLVYTVSMIAGNKNNGLYGQISQEFLMNPPDQEIIETTKFYIFISVTLFILILLIPLILLSITFILPLLGFNIVRLLFKRNKKNNKKH